MNEKQYNNIVFTSLSNICAEKTAQNDFEKVKRVLNNMGVAFPNGDPQSAINILATDDYMGWAACNYHEAKEFANSGIPTIAVKDTEISIVSADISDEDVATVSNSTLVASADALIEEQSTATSYYAYSRATTTNTYYYLSPMSGYQSVYVGWTERFKVKKAPGGAEVSNIIWTTSDSAVATVDANGNVTTKKAGIATIKAKSNSNSKIDFSCELWVQGKRPVFLIHGRVSNSLPTWGAINKIYGDPFANLFGDNHDNNHHAQPVNSFSVGDPNARYVDKTTQDICDYKNYIRIKVNGEWVSDRYVPGIFNGEFAGGDTYYETHREGGNLAYYLRDNGYRTNVNLFAFNYPNRDAVVHSAEKFKKYIENLISYVNNYGSNEMKACFYSSRSDYSSNKYRFNIIGHSMGGLVARYYIENLNQDSHVCKLITICTPHWGSDMAKASNNVGFWGHKLCDHDLHPNSAMYGGSLDDSTEDCDMLFSNCPDYYPITPTLNYNKTRYTKYYAIAGISFDASNSTSNNNMFFINPNLTTYEQLYNEICNKVGTELYKLVPNGAGFTKFHLDVKTADDFVVGLLSQIGWNNTNGATPTKRISMDQIFINIDTDGGNEYWDLFHSKMPHRECVLSKVMECLLI